MGREPRWEKGEAVRVLQCCPQYFLLLSEQGAPVSSGPVSRPGPAPRTKATPNEGLQLQTHCAVTYLNRAPRAQVTSILQPHVVL